MSNYITTTTSLRLRKLLNFVYLWLSLTTFWYIWSPLVTFLYLWLPLVTFPYLFFPFLSFPFLSFRTSYITTYRAAKNAIACYIYVGWVAMRAPCYPVAQLRVQAHPPQPRAEAAPAVVSPQPRTAPDGQYNMTHMTWYTTYYLILISYNTMTGSAWFPWPGSVWAPVPGWLVPGGGHGDPAPGHLDQPRQQPQRGGQQAHRPHPATHHVPGQQKKYKLALLLGEAHLCLP